MKIYIISQTIFHEGGQNIEYLTRDRNEAFAKAEELMEGHLYDTEAEIFYFKEIKDYEQGLYYLRQNYKSKQELKLTVDPRTTFHGKQSYILYRWATWGEAIDILEFNL